MPSLLVMARTVSRTKEANPYESTAITEVRVEGCGAELARACSRISRSVGCSGPGPRPAREACGGPMVGRAPGRCSGRV